MPASSPHVHGFVARYLMLFGGEAFSKLCVLVAFGYLGRVLTPGEYGLVELALSITVFFALGVESGMGLYGARVVAATPARVATLVPEVMVLRGLLAVPAFAAMLVVAYAYRSSGLGLLAINSLALLLSPFLTQFAFQGLGQMQWVATGTAIRNFTFVALVLILVRAGSDIRLVAAAEVGGVVALAVANAFILHRRLRVVLEWRGVAARARRVFRDVWFMGLSDFTWACLWYAPALLLGWMSLDRPEQVAWVASAVRIVLALHTFVFLYFFNLLPNLSRELVSGVDGWRALLTRSLKTSLWPAGLIAVGGTLVAPSLIPLIYGPAYAEAVRPFQIAVWMIPIAWLSGHFRFSLIAAGLQRWEFAVSVATALATVALTSALGYRFGAAGAAIALVTGGLVNLVLAIIAVDRQIDRVPVWPTLLPVSAAAVAATAAGLSASVVVGTVGGAAAGSLVYGAIAVWRADELMSLIWGWRRARG